MIKHKWDEHSWKSTKGFIFHECSLCKVLRKTDPTPRVDTKGIFRNVTVTYFVNGKEQMKRPECIERKVKGTQTEIFK